MSICKRLIPARSCALLCTGIFLAACAPDSDQAAVDDSEQVPSEAEVASDMLESMGGLEALEEVDTLVLEGSGVRNFLGQVPETGAPDGEGELPRLTEIIDLENGRAAFDNSVINSNGFEQERTDVLTRYEGEMIGWGTTNGRANHVTSADGLFSWATHNTPATLLRRNVVTMALTAQGINADNPAQEASLEGETYWQLETMRDDEDVTLYVDQETGLLAAWEVLDTETMRGDKQAVYYLDDYRPVEDLMLPFSLRITRDGDLYADISYDEIRVNDSEALAIFEIPPDVEEQAEQVLATDDSWVSLEWNEVADGVVHVMAFSHHSMVVEFADFVVVVEAPYTDAQSFTLARMIEERIGKPIRYVVPTHPHYDHTGGLRAMVSLGADVKVAAGHEDEIRMILESPHTNPPDALAERREQGEEVGQIEVFEGMGEITDGERTLALYEMFNIPHVSPMTVPLDTQTGILFDSDLFYAGPSANAKALYEEIEKRGLMVETILSGHAGQFPYSQLEEAAQGME